MVVQKLLLYASLALIFCISAIDGEPFFRHDYKYIDSTKAYYKYHQNNIPWKKAKLTCESEGSILYYPENSDEVNVVKTLYRDNIWIWLGASRQESGKIQSVDGRDISDFYHKWDFGEPNDLSGAEDCVVLMDDNGKINDYHCHALYSFVCKVTVRAVESGMIEITSPEKYTDKIGKQLVGHRNFYQYYVNPKTWTEAKKVCEENAAVLAYPEDELEDGTIVDYTNQTYWRDWIWLGASRGSPKFITVDGRILDDVYVNWGPTEPIHHNGNEDCVVLCRDGTYRAHYCKARFPFICKTSVFITAIKPEKGLMHSPPAVGALDTSVPLPTVVQDPYEIIQNLLHNHSISNCTEGNSDCKTTCGIVDKESRSHVYFGSVIGQELQNFPVNKKLDTMYSIMRVIEQKWTETENECIKVTKPAAIAPPPSFDIAINSTDTAVIYYEDYENRV